MWTRKQVVWLQHSVIYLQHSSHACQFLITLLYLHSTTNYHPLLCLIICCQESRKQYHRAHQPSTHLRLQCISLRQSSSAGSYHSPMLSPQIPEIDLHPRPPGTVRQSPPAAWSLGFLPSATCQQQSVWAAALFTWMHSCFHKLELSCIWFQFLQTCAHTAGLAI